MKTLSEIDTTSKRATRGAGFSWGIAEEVGKKEAQSSLVLAVNPHPRHPAERARR